MERDFEVFQGGPNEALGKRLHVTISPAKLILLNRNIYEQLGKPDAVLLGYSRTRDTIAIEPASVRLNQSFPVIASGKSWRINASPFCRHFGIQIDTTLKFVSPDIAGNTLQLNLGNTVSVSRKKIKRKAAS